MSPRRDSIVFYVPYNTVGGSHHSLVGIIRGLDERWAPEIVLAQPGVRVENLLGRTGAPIHLQPSPDLTEMQAGGYGSPDPIRAINGLLHSIRRLRRLLIQRRTRVIYSDGLKGSLVCGLAALGLPTLHWRHVRSAWTHGFLEQAAFRLDDVVVAISRAVLNRVMAWHHRYPERCRIIPNALDPERFAPRAPDEELRARLGLGERPVIGYVGRLTRWKRPEDLFRAVKTLETRYSVSAACLVVGTTFASQDPGYAEELEALIDELDLRDSVVLAGYQPDVRPYTALMDVLALPSDFEPFGRVVIETQAQGIPVVATNSGGVPEIIDDGVNGLLYPVGDVPTLAAALHRLLTDRTLAARLAERGRNRVLESFTLSEQARRINALLDELAPPRP
ncbi:MAG: glycosyltransferase [Candidatus Coatesbacteria bacterium]|nr:glycosyltransferase [Candidatus Coatesbacteria bacterium]